MTTGTQIMERAGILLNDEDHTRWTLPELCQWINEAQKAVVLAKPSALSSTRVLTLSRGTLQSVPTVAGLPTPLALLDIPRNVVADSEPRLGGRTIKVTSRKLLDSQDPYWHDPNRTRFTSEVRHFCFDEQNPLEFYVYPGNDGTGLVEALCSDEPTELEADGADDIEAAYGATLSLPGIYEPVLLDYVLFRAHSKDDTGAMPGRATAHFNQFASAVGIKIQVEGASSPNARRASP